MVPLRLHAEQYAVKAVTLILLKPKFRNEMKTLFINNPK